MKDINIETANFICRSLTVDDVDMTWVAWMNDPEVIAAFGRASPTTLDEMKVWLKNYGQTDRFHDGCILGIFDKKTGVPIGFTTFMFDYIREICFSNSLYIGEANYRHRGTYTEIRGPLAKFVFNDQRMKKIVVYVLHSNTIMLNTLKKKGWQVAKTFVWRWYKNAGDVVRLERTVEDWKNQIRAEGKNG